MEDVAQSLKHLLSDKGRFGYCEIAINAQLKICFLMKRIVGKLKHCES